MASEQFSLCWDNFHKNMSSGMNSLLENEDLVDVTLAVQGKCLKAHKMVLSVCSPYFKELFKSNPCQHPIVFMKDVSYEALSDLLQFMYQGEVQVSQENLTTFIKTAEALQIKGLTGDGNGSADNETTENSQEKPVHHQIEEYKPPPRPKKQPPPAPVVSSSPQVKRPRLSSTSTSNDSQPIVPPLIAKTEPISTPASNITESAPPVQFKMEPYETHSLIDETGDENFGDDTLDDNTVDDTEDYSMMEGGVGEEEPQAGTSTDGAGEGQGSSKLEDSTYLKHFKDETLMLLSSTDYWQDAKFEDTEDLTGEDDNIVNPYQYSAAQVSYQIDCNSQFMWTQFEIPWEQLPSYMINACESGKRDNQIINFIIHTLVNKMREIKTVIPSSAIKIIANKLIDKYPGVFRDVDEDGVVIGDGTYSIFRKIQDRNNYLNRPNKRKSVNENKKPVLNKQKHVAASSSFNINDESLENRIIETFGEQRSFLNRNPTIEEIQKVWPILLKEKAALIHFQQLTKSNLYTLEYTVKEKLPKFLKLLPNYTSRYENPEELLQVLEILTIYFKENLDCIFLELQNAELSEQFPLHPIIVRIGSEYHLYFQRVRIQETLQTLSKCFRLMMSYFFNFNLRYPKDVSLTLELFQRYFLKIHPDSGKQQKMKSCKRVINLMNKLKNL